MTEKRYYKDECFGICDNKKGDSDYTNMMYSDEVVDLLNSLTDENEQLRDFIRKEFPKSHKHILEGFE